MGLFNLFKHVDINAEVEAMKSVENAVLLDVRTEEEYSGGHIPGSKNVPVENIEKVADVAGGRDTGTSRDSVSTNGKSTTSYKVADICQYVKQYVKRFHIVKSRLTPR